MRLPPHALYLECLAGTFPQRRGFHEKEDARAALVQMTGRDFGDDVVAWKAFIRAHLKFLYKPLKELTMNDRFAGEKRLADAVECLNKLNSLSKRQWAFNALRRWTGQDFGVDIPAWEKWFVKNLHRLPPRPRRGKASENL